MRVQNDKYYTPIDLANYCWDKVFEIIGENNISEIIEPSCGNGSFYHHKTHVPHFGYDIEPQFEYCNIITGDFLEAEIPYLWGRLVIGNPPYGRCMHTAQKFYKKAVAISDYIAFILPISQLRNSHSLYEFDLVYSEDLGTRTYTDRDLHCCFNIYKRPDSGELNPRPLLKAKDITIYRQDAPGYDEKEFDVRMCGWGISSGKVLTENEHYAAEYKIKINNEQRREEILNVLNTFDWKHYLHCIAMKKLQQFHIVNVLQENVKGFE